MSSIRFRVLRKLAFWRRRKIRFKVLQKFPIWRRADDDVRVDMIFEIEFFKRRWPEVGGAYFLADSPKDSGSVPDFSGARIAYLAKHKYLEVL